MRQNLSADMRKQNKGKLTGHFGVTASLLGFRERAGSLRV